MMRRSAAEVCAFSLVAVFPDAQIIEGHETDYGFIYDAFLPFNFQEPFLNLIEEKMRGVVKEAIAIESLEMVPDNAAAFFAHLNQGCLAERADTFEGGLISVVRIGAFATIGQGSYLANTAEVGAFRLVQFRDLGEGRVRVYACVHADPKELKKIVKQGVACSEASHLELGVRQELFSPCEGGYIWHPKGVALKERLKKIVSDEGIKPVSTPFGCDQMAVMKAFAKRHPRDSRLVEWREILAEESESIDGLLTPKQFNTDLTLAICDKTEISTVCFSSLQLIIKILKMLSFEFKVVLRTSDSKKRVEPLRVALEQLGEDPFEVPSQSGRAWIEFTAPDREGRQWKISTLELITSKRGEEKTASVACSFFVKLERTVALLLERLGGAFPFWLAPEQLRLFVVGNEVKSYSQKLETLLLGAGYRIEVVETAREQLSAEIYEGVTAQVPYLVVIGKRESETETVTVRERGRKERVTMKVTEFIEILRRDLESK